MATDNRTDQLFPDVIEHYGTDLHVSNDVDFPVPQENYDDNSSDEYGVESDFILPIVQVSAAPAGSDDNPTEELPVYVDELSPDDSEPVAADYSPDGDGGFDEDADPLAAAPDWVRAHIPRHPLVMDDQSRRRKSPRLPRRTPKQIDTPDDVAPAESVAAPQPKERKERAPKPAKAPKVRSSSDERNPWVVRGAAVAVAAVVIGAAIAALSSSSDDAGPPAATGASITVGPTVATTAVAPTWCENSSTGGKVIGRGAGDPTNGVGLIQAFDYAYYVQRDGAKVASMMVTPNPVSTIQASINEAAAIGTEHCLTITPTANPNVFDVELLLRTDSDSEGSVPQRITLANSGSGLKIATIEEIR